MAMADLKTNLEGRLRNTTLPKSHALMPLFEAVVNSIHAIEESENDIQNGIIQIQILRSSQQCMKGEDDTDLIERDITGFVVSDNGVGFNSKNFESFQTLDSLHKQDKGGHGIGRLLWLKAFRTIRICSMFKIENRSSERNFQFDLNGISEISKDSAPERRQTIGTCVELLDFEKKYLGSRDIGKKSSTIAQRLLEHCIWYFIQERVPTIEIIDVDEGSKISVNELFEEYKRDVSDPVSFTIKGSVFQITHMKVPKKLPDSHYIAYFASERMVVKRPPEVLGKSESLDDGNGEFFYVGVVTSKFLNDSVRPERIGFDIAEESEPLWAESEISFDNITSAANEEVKKYLQEPLSRRSEITEKMVNAFIDKKAPRYRPILSRMEVEDLQLPPNPSDGNIEIALHRKFAELEEETLREGQDLFSPKCLEDPEIYRKKIERYLQNVSDLKKSDLAGYVSHRRVIIDLLQKSIERRNDGSYHFESTLHQLIMPMRKDSSEVGHLDGNLWLIDEKMAFHHYFASDKTLKSIPVTGAEDTKEPDMFSLNICDNPILFNDSGRLPLASICLVELKRPMSTGSDAGNALGQIFKYLDKIRTGGIQTKDGRPIPDSKSVPAFCYIICDLTESVRNSCRDNSLRPTSDNMGFFGYHSGHESYVEVISYDMLVNNVIQRNQAFFDALGLPSSR